MDYLFIKSTKEGMADYGSVYARVRTKKYNRKYALGFTISKQEWISYRTLKYSSKHMMTSIGIPYGQFALILAQIKLALEDRFVPEKVPSVITSIKSHVVNGKLAHLSKSKGRRWTLTLSEYIVQYISECQSGVRFKKGGSQRLSPGYIRSLTTLLHTIQAYEKDRGLSVTLKEVNMNFQRDFVQWNKARGIRPNTINNRMSTLKTLMNRAYEEKLTTNNTFLHSEFVPRGETVDHIYLTPEHIEELIRFNIADAHLSNTAKVSSLELEQTRDAFLVGCLTGQRFSDFIRISMDMVVTLYGIPFISIVQTKTKKKVLIPLDKLVREILLKHGGSLPQQSNARFNRNLRIVAEMMGWTQRFMRGDSKEGPRFCDMIGSHTARRSFATNAYAANVPIRSIMAITGHSLEKTLRKYLKLQVEDNAMLAAKDFAGILSV